MQNVLYHQLNASHAVPERCEDRLFPFRVPHARPGSHIRQVEEPCCGGNSHDDERRLHTRLEDTQKKPNHHERGKVLGSRGASDDAPPAKDIDSQIFRDGELLKEEVGGVFADEDAHVKDCSQPSVCVSFARLVMGRRGLTRTAVHEDSHLPECS